jgi:hypothetical protein
MRDAVILVPLIIVVELVFALLCLLPLGIVWVIMYYFYLMMKSYVVGPLFDLLWFGIGLYFFCNGSNQWPFIYEGRGQKYGGPVGFWTICSNLSDNSADDDGLGDLVW